MRTRNLIGRLGGLVLVFILAACATAPYTGRSQLMLVTPGEEIALGVQASKEILQKEPISNDPYYNDLVRRVGMRIAQAANRPNFQWEFYVIDKPKVVNAFCLPGGKIFVYTGLFKYAETESELATVMAHEVGHALARHGAERMSMILLAQLGEAAAAAALDIKSNEAAFAFDMAYGVVVTLGVLLPYSRTQEYEADHIGLILMSIAGYDPHAALSFWEKMAQNSKNKPTLEFLSTHPLDQHRIARIQALMPEAMRYYRASKEISKKYNFEADQIIIEKKKKKSFFRLTQAAIPPKPYGPK